MFNAEKKILITRPKQDTISLAEYLKDRGHNVFIESLIAIEYYNINDIDLENLQAIIITSANGIRALSAITRNRDIPIVTVGHMSAQEAIKLGFLNVSSATNRNQTGNVDLLIDYIESNFSQENGVLLHISAKHITGNLKDRLERKGFDIERITMYEAKALTYLSVGLKGDLQNDKIGAVLLYSPRTADIFLKLLIQENMDNYIKNIDFLCLSQAVADSINRIIPDLKLKIAKIPTNDSLVSLIDKI